MAMESPGLVSTVFRFPPWPLEGSQASANFSTNASRMAAWTQGRRRSVVLMWMGVWLLLIVSNSSTTSSGVNVAFEGS